MWELYSFKKITVILVFQSTHKLQDRENTPILRRMLQTLLSEFNETLSQLESVTHGSTPSRPQLHHQLHINIYRPNITYVDKSAGILIICYINLVH
jgi:hypothetical protein